MKGVVAATKAKMCILLRDTTLNKGRDKNTTSEGVVSQTGVKPKKTVQN